ncbi:MAG: outer membrane protein assembly factor BamA [Candidatus Kapabacteria bacterium]|nr:outer membrane protein assembly factor BamA [Candidatus Kapabacteria bacterium]
MLLRTVSITLLGLLAAVLPVLSQTENTPKRLPVIAGVTVEGNRFVDESTIISISGLRVGDELNPRTDVIPNAIKNIWQRRQFSDVQIIIDKITSLGVFLRIAVKENPRFSYLIVEGNDKIAYEKIKTEVNKFRGDLLPYSDLREMVIAVRKIYDKEGLLFARITADTITTDTAGYVRVKLNIEEGDEYKVLSVKFTGNQTVPQSDLAGALVENTPKSWWQIWRSAKFDKSKFYKDDVPAIVNYYKKNGYIEADTTSISFSIDSVNKGINIVVGVREGTKYYLRNVKFDGSTVYTDEALLKRLDVERGKPYNEERVDKNLNANEDQTDVRSLYLDNGYLQCQLVPELQRVGADSIDLTVKIFENERFTIRRVDIAGNTKTQDRVVRRELFTRPGDFFNRAAIIRSIKGLGVLNFFNPEKLRPDVKMAGPKTVDLTYQVEERSTDVLNASVGYAGTFGLTASIGVTFNNFDISDPLRGGAGQVFSFQFDNGFNTLQGGATSIRTINISFAEPWLFGNPTSAGFSIFDSRTIFNFGQRTTGVQGNIGRRFRFPDDYFRGDWSLSVQRRVQFSQFTNTQNQFVSSGAGDIVFWDIPISQTISRNSFDNLIFPTNGSRFRWTTRWGIGALVGSNDSSLADYMKNEIQFEFVNPLLQVDGFTRLVMYLNSEFGYIDNILTRNTFIPFGELYTMGGNGLGAINGIPLRGYEDRTVGAVGNANKLYFKQTAELRFALSLNPMPIYLSAFAEAGNAWASFATADLFNLKRSAGLGMRILLNPIGLIGFDYGYGFDQSFRGDGQPSGWRFHFQFGR